MDDTSSYSYEPEPIQPEPAPEGSKNWLYIVLGVVIVVVIALFLWLLFGARGEAPPTVPADDSWAKVESAGVLRVGTAADYPPFEYYSQTREIDGFDPALIRAIGRKLGVEVEITDFAFQGLGGALQIGQVDALVSALSITPERESIAEFSNVYYIGEDGILANEGAGIDAVESAADFRGKRVGVQDASVYEGWAQAALVDAGIISQDQLYVYAKAEHAVNDLEINRLDLVVLDYKPATIADTSKDVKLVGRSLNQQRFAIAVPEGALALRDQLNLALVELVNDGTMGRLYQQYLNLDYEAIPTPEPTDEADPTATPAECINSMAFVRDLTYDDNDFKDLPELDPGEKFAKGWRIKNTGTCTWTEDYYLGFVRGDRMSGKDTFLDSKVKPGATFDMYVDLVAPDKAGEYTGWWQMNDEGKNAFGETIWLAIEVVTGTPPEPTKTPGPTKTPPIVPTATQVPPTQEPPIEPTPTATEHPASDLIGPTWVLVEYTVPDGDPKTEDLPVIPIEDVDVTALFNEFDEMGGFGGCNTYRGVYLSDGKLIEIDGIMALKVACDEPEGINQQEVIFFDLLELAEEYAVDTNEKEMEMVFTEKDSQGRENEVVILKFEVK